MYRPRGNAYSNCCNDKVTVVFKATVILRLNHRVTEEEYESELTRYKETFKEQNVILLRYNDANVVDVIVPPSQTL